MVSVQSWLLGSNFILFSGDCSSSGGGLLIPLSGRPFLSGWKYWQRRFLHPIGTFMNLHWMSFLGSRLVSRSTEPGDQPSGWPKLQGDVPTYPRQLMPNLHGCPFLFFIWKLRRKNCSLCLHEKLSFCLKIKVWTYFCSNLFYSCSRIEPFPLSFKNHRALQYINGFKRR